MIKSGQGFTVKFISYTRLLLQDWKRWLFYLMHKTNRESRKMRKWKNMFQMIKPQDRNLNEEVYLMSSK